MNNNQITLLDYDYCHSDNKDWECLIFYKDNQNKNMLVSFDVSNRQACNKLFSTVNNILEKPRIPVNQK